MSAVARAARVRQGAIELGLRLRPGLEHLKTLLLLYVVLTRTLQLTRHLRARGVSRSARDIVNWVAQRAVRVALQFPATKKKVAEEMGKAKLDIEAKLVPKGAEVSRHLALPENGKSAEWIVKEMEKMDAEGVSKVDWKHGKLSGAVYRKWTITLHQNQLRLSS
jgi:sphinganine-1-phosphate aldolase